MTRSVLHTPLIAVALVLGLAPGAWAFRGWVGGPRGATGIAASPQEPTGALGIAHKARHDLDTFAAAGAGDGSGGFSPWLGTGLQWKPAGGLTLSLEGRALLPDPTVDGETTSGLAGGLTIQLTGW